MHVIISGQVVDYLELKPGGPLILTGGTRLTFDQINLFYFNPPDMTGNLVEIEYLAFGRDKWMLGDKSLFESLAKIETAVYQQLKQLNPARVKNGLSPISEHGFSDTMYKSNQISLLGQSEAENALIQKLNEEFFNSTYRRRWGLSQLLRDQDHDQTLKKLVRAVAWFEGDDTPVLLKDFSPIKSQLTIETENKLRLAEKELEEAKQTTLAKALEMWTKLDFNPPGMGIVTKSKIEKAVRVYMAPGKHSLAIVAKEFGVTRQCVSRWFKIFHEQTGFEVVTFKRHESVESHLKALESESLPAKKTFSGNLST